MLPTNPATRIFFEKEKYLVISGQEKERVGCHREEIHKNNERKPNKDTFWMTNAHTFLKK